jgi:hypothetical protein
VPLGIVTLDDGEDIEDWEDYENIIPLDNFKAVQSAPPAEDKPEKPKVNPQTGDNLMIIIFALILIIAAGVVVKKYVIGKKYK